MAHRGAQRTPSGQRIADILSARAQRVDLPSRLFPGLSGLRPLADRMSAIRCTYQNRLLRRP